MNKKIKNFIDGLFSDIPNTRSAVELKDELHANLQERYGDYIAQGKSESQAYSQAIASLGDVDELLQDVMPTKEFKKEAHHYRMRQARNVSIGVGLYIIGAAILVSCTLFAQGFGWDEDVFVAIGLMGLFLCAAPATTMIVYTNMSTPQEFKHVDEDEVRDNAFYQTKKGQSFKLYESIVWPVVVALYLLASFSTYDWHVTWIIFPITALANTAMKGIIELRESHG